MYVTADRLHPAFDMMALGSLVFLDGVEQRQVLAADDEAGLVECAATDANGHILHDRSGVQVQLKHGKVVIIRPDVNYDAWMRERTDKAHAEYMARHSAGGRAYQ